MIGSIEKIRLGVFDINGTIHNDETGIPGEIRAGFENLHKKDIATTIITGRGLARARSLLANDWSDLVSEGMPVSVENGSRLVTAGGHTHKHHMLNSDEITALVDGVNDASGHVRYLAYHSRNAMAGAVLWAAKSAPVDDFIKGHGNYSRYIASLDGFISDLAEDDVSMVIIGGDKSVDEALGNSNTVINGNELNVLAAGVDKSSGVIDMAEYFDLDLSEVMVAGNDHNDLSMLALGAGRSIFVDGILDERPPIEGLEVVESVRGLGQHLQA